MSVTLGGDPTIDILHGIRSAELNAQVETPVTGTLQFGDANVFDTRNSAWAQRLAEKTGSPPAQRTFAFSVIQTSRDTITITLTMTKAGVMGRQKIAFGGVQKSRHALSCNLIATILDFDPEEGVVMLSFEKP